MIEYVRGDLLQADVDALVNPVNCVGVMGCGLALQFKQAYPGNFMNYAAICKAGWLQPGRMLVHGTCRPTGPRFVINFPTKRHWKDKSRLEDIEAGLTALVDVVRDRKIASLALPPLGCGLGGLKWSDVRPLIEAAFGSLPAVRILSYRPT